MEQYRLNGILWTAEQAEHWLLNGGSASGITEPTVAQVLYALVIANNCQLVVETGTKAGTTSAWLAHGVAATRGQYLGFEKEAPSAAVSHAVVSKITSRAQVIQGEAPQVVTQHIKPNTVDLLFVDDDHAKDHIQRELEAFMPLMVAGGLLCFHDVLGNFAIWDLIKPLGAIRLVNHHYNPKQAAFGGLGVLVCENS